MSNYKNLPPALEITVDEINDLTLPYVVAVAGKTYALKSANSFSLDDYYRLAEQADLDPREVIDTIAIDKATNTFLRSTGQGVLTRILKAWFQTVGVTPGESDGSES